MLTNNNNRYNHHHHKNTNKTQSDRFWQPGHLSYDLWSNTGWSELQTAWTRHQQNFLKVCSQKELILHDLRRWGDQGTVSGILCITLHSIRCLMDAWWWWQASCPFACEKSGGEREAPPATFKVDHMSWLIRAALFPFQKKELLVFKVVSLKIKLEDCMRGNWVWFIPE